MKNIATDIYTFRDLREGGYVSVDKKFKCHWYETVTPTFLVNVYAGGDDIELGTVQMGK